MYNPIKPGKIVLTCPCDVIHNFPFVLYHPKSYPFDTKMIECKSRHIQSWQQCYVAVCNNYAICNKLQTALNCNAVCNTSYFKLRCDVNAICNVLQIASKFYHLLLKRRKKIDQRQNASLQSYFTMNSARHQSIRARHAKLPFNTTIVQNAILPPALLRNRGMALKPIRPSVYRFVCPSLCLSQKL